MLEKRKQVLGEHHPFTLAALRNLGLACWDQDKDDDAEACLTQALQGQRRVLGADNSETVGTMGDLAYWYARHGRHEESATLFAETVEIWRARAPGEEPYYAALSDFANEKKSLGQMEEAEALYEEAFAGLRELGSPRMSVVAYNLACLAAVSGEKEKALERLRAAVEAGFDDAEWIRQDGELASLRREGEFEEIVRSAGE